ncbi:hypothetical protein EIP86_010322 [Pleurotus ostreatoroseus]|nr:hypothetical protein EIP86_010322 [Pleurotus ostreatoroseus]
MAPQTRDSPRARHAALHSRLRAGAYFDAATLAKQTVQDGIRLRRTTLEILVEALCKKTSSVVLSARRKVTGPPKLCSDDFLHAGTRMAYELLSLARERGQPRTLRMYYAMIKTCKGRGELVNAALIFAQLAQDWQAYEPTVRARSGPRSDALREEGVMYRPKKDPLLPPYPRVEQMNSIVRDISDIISQPPTSPDGDERFQEALQAFAVLVCLIDESHMHFGSLATIFSTIYRSPRTDHRVWVTREGTPAFVNASRYFYRVLARVIDAILGKDTMALPPLDKRAYNSLLYFVLCHRKNRAQASRILEHMCDPSGRNMKPTVDTFNVFTNAGIALGKLDLSKAALQALQHARARIHSDPTGLWISGAFASVPAVTDSFTTQEGSFTPPANANKLTRQVAQLSPGGPNVVVGVTTVNSLLRLLASQGQSHVVADQLWHALPELASIDHPASDRLRAHARSDGDDSSLTPSRRIADLRRAAALGPRFYATVLATLHKARRTGLAERFWLLAAHAERASWLPGFAPGVAPWVLPVHAHTSMLQCYLADAACARAPPPVLADDPAWVPKTDAHLRGWARFVYQRRQMAMQRGWGGGGAEGRGPLTPREEALLYFRSMLSGGEAVYWALEEVHRVPELRPLRVVPPRPDALFFNIALKLFTLRPASAADMHAQTRAGPRSRRDVRDQDQLRSNAMRWTPMAQTVADAMAEAGHPLPAFVRPVFEGRNGPGSP